MTLKNLKLLPRRSLLGLLVCFVFMLSGATSLIYESVWLRLFTRLLGAGMPAMTSSVAIFMLGLSLGAFCFRLRPRRLFNCLLAYGLLETFIGLYALFLPFALKLDLWQDLATSLPKLSLVNGTTFSTLNFLAPFLLLFLPTCAMGATFPIAFKIYKKAGYRKDIPLYAINLTGAILGLLTSQEILLPLFGLSQTNLLTAGINLGSSFILILAAVLVNRSGQEESQEKGSGLNSDGLTAGEESQDEAYTCANFNKTLFTSLALASFCSLSLEISLSRLFVLCFGSTLKTYTTVLACILLGLFGGCLLAGHLFKKQDTPACKQNFAWLFAITGINLLFVLYFADRIAWIGFNLGSLIAPDNWLAPGLVLTGIIFIVPSSLLLGTILPASLSLLPKHPGKLYAISTLAGVIGTLITGYFVLPGLSLFLSNAIQTCILLTSLILCTWALALSIRYKSFAGGFALLATLISLGCLITQKLPWPSHALSGGIYAMEGLPIRNLSFEQYLKGLGVGNENNQLLFYKDGLEATVSVIELKDQNLLLLKDNGKVEAAAFLEAQPSSASQDSPPQTSPPAPEQHPSSATLSTSNLSTQALLGYAPHLLRPNFKCSNAFVIGYGSGVTTGALLKANQPDSCLVCEIEPVQLEAKEHFRKANELALQTKYLKEKKLSFLSADARFVLKSANNDFDLIVSQPSEPWLLGSADLFTKEFFQLVHSRLSKPGIFCQWLQLYGLTDKEFKLLLETFESSFEHSAIIYDPNAAEIILAGSKSPLDKEIDSKPDLITNQASLYNTDDNLILEYRHKTIVGASQLQDLIKNNTALLNKTLKKSNN